MPSLNVFLSLKLTMIIVSLYSIVSGDRRLNFDKLVHTYIEHGYASFKAVSVVQCCIACKADTLCASVSYMNQTRTCQLNDRNPVDYPTFTHTSTTMDWTSYELNIFPCSPDWILYNRHCYLVVTKAMPWTDANTNCQSHGGHLASIEENAENNFVFNAVSSKEHGIWIGLNDRETEGNFVYTNRNHDTYRNFAPGQPNESGEEDCVEILNKGQWNDQSCAASRQSVCEKYHY